MLELAKQGRRTPYSSWPLSTALPRHCTTSAWCTHSTCSPSTRPGRTCAVSSTARRSMGASGSRRTRSQPRSIASPSVPRSQYCGEQCKGATRLSRGAHGANSSGIVSRQMRRSSCGQPPPSCHSLQQAEKRTHVRCSMPDSKQPAFARSSTDAPPAQSTFAGSGARKYFPHLPS